jgi:hypothetical protein
MGGACGARREIKHLYKIMVGKLERKRPIGKTKCKWKDNIKTDLKGIWNKDVDSIRVALCKNWWQDRIKVIAY